MAIAAASILAKTHRDEYMKKLHEEYPCLRLDQQQRLPDQKHREGILLHGVTPYHRQSFTLLDPQLKLDFDH